MTTKRSLEDRLSLNQITTENLSIQEAVDGCLKHGYQYISLWRHKVEATGLSATRKIIEDSGLKMSSLCRGGMFPAASEELRKSAIEDNKRAIEEAAELGSEVLVLVCGPAPDKDIAQARKWVEEGIAELIPHAKAHGVKLGIEPLHPMYAADRSVISTLGQANTIAEKFNVPEVGVVIDVFHVWWDPDLYDEIKRSTGRILGFHVSDWKVPITDTFMARHLMGEGVIEIKKIREAVEAAGYDGPIEVEIMNQDLWDLDGDDALRQVKESYLKFV